jgi:hypothetical protein
MHAKNISSKKSLYPLFCLMFSCVKPQKSDSQIASGQTSKIPHFMQCDGVQGLVRNRIVIHQLPRSQGVLQYKAQQNLEKPSAPTWAAVKAPLSGPNPALTVPYQLEKLQFKPISCQNISEVTPFAKISEEVALLIPKDTTSKIAERNFSPDATQYLRFHIKRVASDNGKLEVYGYFERNEITLGGKKELVQDSIKKGHLILIKQLVEGMPIYGEKFFPNNGDSKQSTNFDFYGYHPKRLFGWVKKIDIPCGEKDKNYIFDNDFQQLLRLQIEI